LSQWIILAIAAFLAGVLNSIAGGGSFLTFPALVMAGIAPVPANATSAVAVFPGYLGGIVGYRAELASQGQSFLLRYLVCAFTGGLIGSLLLLITSNAFFSLLVPWLLLIATLAFGCGEQVLKLIKKVDCRGSFIDNLTVFLVSVYGGYFNGGLGIILLAVFIVLGHQDLNLMNGLKNVISFFIACVSVAAFSIAGIVQWPEATVMMVASTAGGYYGAVVAKKIPATILKYLITAIGFVMTVIFFYRT
jgi:uncharacterized protein